MLKFLKTKPEFRVILWQPLNFDVNMIFRSATLMGLIFARTNFRELENFAFREDLFSRMSCFTIFREDLLSRIGYAENFRKY